MNSEIGRIKSREKKIDALMNLAKKHGPETQSIAEDIAKQFGGYTTPLNYKSRKSISRKFNSGEITKEVKDSARTTIILPEENIESALAELQKNSRFSRLKRQDDAGSGYKGNIVNLSFGQGFMTEIQVNTAEMIYAKETVADAYRILGGKEYRRIYSQTGMPGGWGHRYYETTREKNRLSRKGTFDKNGRTKRGSNDSTDSRAYYSNFKKK